MWKVELSLFFPPSFFKGVQKQSFCLPCMAGAVNSLQWLEETRLRQVLCITSTALDPLDCKTEPVSRGGAAPNDPNMSFVWRDRAVVDLQTEALKHPWFHTCVINTNTLTTVQNDLWFQAAWLVGGSRDWIFVFRKDSVQLKKTMLEGKVNANFSRHLRSDSSRLRGRLVLVVWVQNHNKDFTLNPSRNPSGCVKMATVQKCKKKIKKKKKKRVKVHIYILYIEHSWANPHIMVA